MNNNFLSVGGLACGLQRQVQDVQRAAVALGIEPAMHLNAVPYYRGDDARRIGEHIAAQQAIQETIRGGAGVMLPHGGIQF